MTKLISIFFFIKIKQPKNSYFQYVPKFSRLEANDCSFMSSHVTLTLGNKLKIRNKTLEYQIPNILSYLIRVNLT